MNNKIIQPLLSIIILFTIGCTKSPSITSHLPQSISQDTISYNTTKNAQQLRNQTDQILIALATRQYKLLPRLYNAAHSASTIAHYLLGQKLVGAYLGSWRVEDIAVSISQDNLTANTITKTTYRMTPNQKAKQAIFTFYFSRASIQSNWEPILK